MRTIRIVSEGATAQGASVTDADTGAAISGVQSAEIAMSCADTTKATLVVSLAELDIKAELDALYTMYDGHRYRLVLDEKG